MSVSFSVLIPCYNSQQQEYTNFKTENISFLTIYKIYVINDCSTDSTQQILNEYKQLGKIHYLQNRVQNKGSVIGRKELIKLARQDYILFIDNDDQFANGNVFQMYADLIQKYRLDIITTDFHVQKLNQNAVFTPSQIDDQIIVTKGVFDYSFKIFHHFLLWNKAIKRQVIQKLQIPDKVVYGCDDHMFSLQLYLNANSLGIFRTQPTYIHYYGAGQWGRQMDQLTMRRFCQGYKQTLIYNFQYILKNRLGKKYFQKCYNRYQSSYLKFLANDNKQLLKIYDQFFDQQFVTSLNKILWQYK